MATFIALISETQQGEDRIEQSVDRAENFRKKAKDFSVTVKEIFWTLGEYDGVVVFDAPDDESAAALLVHLTSQGSVRTKSLRAFDTDEMRAILAKALS